MKAIGRRLDQVVGRVEHASALDAAADKVSGLVGRMLPTGRIKNLASGTDVGHPLHPALVAVPIGCWLASAVVDLAPAPDRRSVASSRRIAQRLVGLGLIAAIPTAIAGTSDWLDTAGGERRLGLVHALANSTAITGYAASWLLRRSGHHRAGIATSIISGGLLGAAGWLGGHLVYAAGVGVDTTVFQKFPARWTDAGLGSDDVADGSAVGVEVNGVPILVSRAGSKRHAIANRCTHRGAPLDSGEIADGCVTCPWHGSRFDLAGGALVRGPATRPQPGLEARVVKGRIQVRRPDEVRTLRRNPVGV